MLKKQSNILDWPQKGLSPQIWNEDNTLKPNVKQFILGFISSFAQANNFKDTFKWITQIKFVGSLTTNLWNSSSDLDIHCEVDLPKFVATEHPEMTEKEASDYLDGIRKQVDQVKAKVSGTEHPLEIFFENEFTNKASQQFSGTYSVLEDKWLVEPHIVGEDFDIATLHPDLLNLAKETASELDSAFGEIKRDIQDIKELNETINNWPVEQRELFEKKLQKRLDDLTKEIEDLIVIREDVAEKRKHYDAISEQEVRFKYLQKYFYMHVLTDLKTLLKQSPELTVKDIPVVENIMNQASLKEAAIGFGMWMSPQGKIIDVGSHPDYAFDNAKELGLKNIPEEITDENAGETYASLMTQMFEKGWVRLRLMSRELNVELYDLEAIPDMINDFIIEHPTEQVRVANAWGDDVTVDYDSVIDNGIQKAINLEYKPEGVEEAANLKLAYQEDENRILVDMDDTICHETPDNECGEPMEGVKEALTKLKEMGYEIVIFSHRADDKHGEDEIKKYLEDHEIPYDSIYKGEKPLARFQIDDRAIHFDNWNSVLKQIEKSASLNQKYWIDPNGKEYEFGVKLGHYGFVMKMLGIDPYEPHTDEEQIKIEEKTKQMLKEGWSRVSPEGSGQFAIEVNDIESLPPYLDNFVAKHFDQSEAEKGWHIEIDDQLGGFVQILDPFPTLQDAVNKKLSQQISVTPKAAALNLPVIDPTTFKRKEPYALFIGTQRYSKDVAVDLFDVFGEHPMVTKSNEMPTVTLDTLIENNIPVIGKEPRAGDKNPVQDISALFKKAQLGSEYDYSSTQFNLPKELSERIIRWAVENIPEEEIVYDSVDPGTKGVQLESHVTLKYGLLTNDFEEVQKALDGEKAPRIKFSKTSFFEPKGKDYDVVIIKVESEDLQNLNKRLCDAIKHEDTQGKEYRPHVTVAYVKKGTGNKWEGKDIITGEEIDLGILLFSPKEGEKRELELGKKTEKESSFMPSNTDLAPSDDWAGTVGYPTNESMDAPQNKADEETWYSPENDRPRTKNFWEKMLSLFKRPLSKKEPKDIVPVKEASLDQNYWLDPSGKEYGLGKQGHWQWIHNNLKKLKQYDPYEHGKYGLVDPNVSLEMEQDAVGKAMMEDGWIRIVKTDGKDADFAATVQNLSSIPSSLDNFIAKHYTGKGILISDNSRFDPSSETYNYVKVDDPFPNIQKAVSKVLQQKRLGKKDIVSLKEAAMFQAMWIDPKGQPYELAGGEIHNEWIAANLDFLKSEYGIQISPELYEEAKLYFDAINAGEENIELPSVDSVWQQMLQQGWVRIGDASGVGGVAVELQNFKYIPSFVDSYISEMVYDGETIEVSDTSDNLVKVTYPFKSLQQAVNKALSSPTKTAAVFPVKLWIDPNGKEYTLPERLHHGDWIKQNKELLLKYGIDFNKSRDPWQDMLRQGWTRILTYPSGALGIEVEDRHNIPSYLDDFISKYYSQGQKIEIGDEEGSHLVSLTDPFPTLQEAISKNERYPMFASKKEASSNVFMLETDSGLQSKALKDPTPDQAVNLFNSAKTLDDGMKYLRWASDENGHLYMWDGYYLTHWEAVKQIPADWPASRDLNSGHFEKPEQAADWAQRFQKDWERRRREHPNVVFTSKQETVKEADYEWRTGDAYWIAPDGQVFNVRKNEKKANTHVEWVYNNQGLLKNEYGIVINPKDFGYPEEHRFDYSKINNMLISKGWVRVDGDSIQIKSIRQPFPVEAVYSLVKDKEQILIEDLNSTHLFVTPKDILYGPKYLQQQFKHQYSLAAAQKIAKQWTTPTEHVNQPGMAWGWVDYIYNYVDENWKDWLIGWLELDPKNYVKPIILIEKIYQDEGRVSAWVHIEFVNTVGNTDAFMKLVISADTQYEPSYEPEGVETIEYLNNWEIEVLDYGKSDELEKTSVRGKDWKVDYYDKNDSVVESKIFKNLSEEQADEETHKNIPPKAVGYNIKQTIGNISEAIKQITNQCLFELKDQIKKPTTWDINNGMCGNWAEEIEDLVPGAEAIWLDQYDPDLAHMAVKYKGLWYDAEAPEGVDDWKKLPVVLNKNKTREQVLKERQEKTSGYGPTNYKGPSVADELYQDSPYRMNVTYSPEEDEELMDQNGKGGYPNRWMSRHRGPYYTNEGKVVKMLEETSALETLPPQQPITENTNASTAIMMDDGSIYFSNEPYMIHVKLIKQLGLPAEHIASGGRIVDGTYIDAGSMSDTMRYVERELARQRVEKKRQALGKKDIKADISGQVVNNILKLIQQTGGATYNLSKGNLVGTNAYAVAIYPDREQIVPEADFDVLEGYITKNEDLLSNPNNSFGAWISGGNKVYLDIINVVKDKEKALNIARKYKQLAIFDLHNLVEIPVQTTQVSSIACSICHSTNVDKFYE